MASIRKITGKGGVSFKITVAVGRDAHGKQIRHYKTWKPDRPMSARQMEKEAAQVAVDFEREIEKGFQPDCKYTFAEYAEYVLSIRELRGDKPQTISRVKRQTARINEHIGHMKIVDIRPQHLTNLYKKLLEPGQNKWMEFAVPAVDFGELLGDDNYNEFAEKCGVYGRLIANICRGQKITLRNAQIIEKNLGKKGLFEIVGGGKSLSVGTVRDYHAVIMVVFRQAFKEMIIPYNPAERATLPTQRKKDIKEKCLQPEEAKRVLDALESEPLNIQALITLFIMTGCRRGEIIGLKWDHVNLDEENIKIDCSINYTKDLGVFEGPTKTYNNRTVFLTAETAALLRKLRTSQIQESFRLCIPWEESRYIFARYDGRPVNPASVNLILTEFCKRHNLPHINPHKFRHTAASIMLSNGVDVLTVSKMLGHSDTSTTLDVYGHSIDGAQKKAAEKLENIILEKNA